MPVYRATKHELFLANLANEKLHSQELFTKCYRSVSILLNLFKRVKEKRILFHKLNKFSITGAEMLDFIYHII